MPARSPSVEFLSSRLEERRHLLEGAGARTEAFRLVDGEGDGPPGLWLDVLGAHWLVQVKDRGLPCEWEDLPGRGLCESLWLKQLSREEKDPPLCVAGAAPERFAVVESGMRFEIQPAAGYSCGLFLDQRDNRARVRAAAGQGRRVLNLFSYTCSFSVAAALGGAVTTSVDLSSGYLEWGRRNFALNGLDAAAHHWIRGDSFDWLAAFAKKGRLFDGVVLDPPTFSRGIRKKVFRLERDLAELVALTAAVVAPGGWLLACANTLRLSAEEFEVRVREGLSRAGRATVGGLTALPMPPDFTAPPYLKSLWIEGLRGGASA